MSKEIFWTYDELERLGEQLELYYNANKCCTVPIGAVEEAILQVYSYEGVSPHAGKLNGYVKYYPVVIDEPWGEPWTILYGYDALGRIVDESIFSSVSGKQVEHIHWSYIEVPKGLLVREEHDREGWVESSWENPEWSVTYPLDGKTDFGYEWTYDHEGRLIARRSFTGGAVYQVSATIDGKPTTVEVFGNNDGGGNWESRYDNFGRLAEEWSWPDDWSRIFENDDPIYRVFVWRYDGYGRPLMRIDTGYSWNDKSIIWGVLSYHYDCWESFAPPASGAPP